MPREAANVRGFCYKSPFTCPPPTPAKATGKCSLSTLDCNSQSVSVSVSPNYAVLQKYCPWVHSQTQQEDPDIKEKDQILNWEKGINIVEISCWRRYGGIQKKTVLGVQKLFRYSLWQCLKKEFNGYKLKLDG